MNEPKNLSSLKEQVKQKCILAYLSLVEIREAVEQGLDEDEITRALEAARVYLNQIEVLLLTSKIGQKLGNKF
jgi:hypothetical protein